MDMGRGEERVRCTERSTDIKHRKSGPRKDEFGLEEAEFQVLFGFPTGDF